MNLGALRNAATALGQAGDRVSARRIMEFVYTRQLDREELARPVFLGLAEIRVQQGNVPAALELAAPADPRGRRAVRESGRRRCPGSNG